LIFALYGAMLPGVAGVVVGAGNPDGLPALCSDLAKHATVITDLPVLYRESGEKIILSFDAGSIAQGRITLKPLVRPIFLAIVPLRTLSMLLLTAQANPRMVLLLSTIPPEDTMLRRRDLQKMTARVSYCTANRRNPILKPFVGKSCLSGWREDTTLTQSSKWH
jgi:hypothetical protein